MLSSIISRKQPAPHSNPAVDAPAPPTPYPEHPSIALLNHSLKTLLDVFPAAEIEHIRRLLSTSSEESRIYVVTEILLKSGGGGSAGASSRARGAVHQLEPWQRFRSDEYKNSVKKQLYFLPAFAYHATSSSDMYRTASPSSKSVG